MENNRFKFVTNNKNYVLIFQGIKYDRFDFESYYESEVEEGELEFLPGIVYEIKLEYSILVKWFINLLKRYNGVSRKRGGV